MVSLVQKENSGEIAVIPRDEIPWESIRLNLQFSLTRKGVSLERAEEYASAAVCDVLCRHEQHHCLSVARAKMDCRMRMQEIRQLEAQQRANVVELIDDFGQSDNVHAGRLSRLSPLKTSTAVNDLIANRRATRILFAWFSRKYWPVDCPAN